MLWRQMVNFAEVSKEKINLLRTGVALLVLVVAAISWAGYRTILDFKAAIGSVTRTHGVLEQLETTSTVLHDAETGTRDFVLTKKTEYLESYTRSSEIFQEHLRQLRTLTAEDPVQQARVTQLEERSAALGKLALKTVEQRNKSLAAALRVMKTEEAQRIREEIRQLIASMKSHEKDLLARRQESAAKRIRANTVSCVLLLAADVACLIWITVLSFRLNRLQRVIRVCAWTKQVNHEGRWITLEEYLETMLEAPVTHGICAEAAASMMAETNAAPAPRVIPSDPIPVSFDEAPVREIEREIEQEQLVGMGR